MNKEAADKYIQELKELAAKYDVSKLAGQILNYTTFKRCSGSSHPNVHHYGEYGLLTHTYEVVMSCMKMRELYPQYDIDEKELFCAALFHDVGKMWDYEEQYATEENGPTSWKSTDHKKKIYHITRSVIEWNQICIDLGIGVGNFVSNVTHAILAHHGRPEWGSPVAPQTRVAWILHLCDGISARLYDVDTIGLYSK